MKKQTPGRSVCLQLKNKVGHVHSHSREEKQVCDKMNKICELLMICILMTNHHANHLVCGLCSRDQSCVEIQQETVSNNHCKPADKYIINRIGNRD